MNPAYVSYPKPDFSVTYVAMNADGTWGEDRYHPIRLLPNAVGEFLRMRDGAICEIAFAKLHKVEIAKDAPDPVEANETRRYRQRSRVTARQRGAKPCTAKQRSCIIAVGFKRGLTFDDLRKMAPRGSLSDLTVQEASNMIDRLKGNGARRSSR